MNNLFSEFFISYTNIFKIIILSVISELVLFILSKIMGNKEMSQLTMFDYIIGITIGSIAAEMATSLENNFMEPLIAMIVYALISIAISIISYKSITFRRLIYGNSLILLDNGELYKKNFKTGKLDINEFLQQCRTSGYFNLNDIQTAILEPNGKISFLPKAAKRPLTPSDMNLTSQISTVLTNIIIDGHIIQENLQNSGHDLVWLNNELGKQNISDISDVFLAMCDNNNNLSVYTKKEISNSHNFFN
jgi:uncharacterized membrane protein YcaP (DUF421 family)